MPPPHRLAEAVEFALAAGLLKYAAPGRPQHAPFSLAPCPIPGALHRELEALTVPFNVLAWSVSRDAEFLAGTLAAAAAVDEYTAFLAGLARPRRSQQPLELLITRNDYFLAARPGGAPAIRQVELNTIAASYPGLSGLAHRLHRQVWFDQPWAGNLAKNDPLTAIADGIADAMGRYGHADAIAAMIVQPGESNVFDQRLLEAALRERGIDMRRLTLREIGEQSAIREGHLTIQGRIVALAYYRAGYTPEDLGHPAARAGMERIARSSAISVPTPAAHLAGTKKVQQVLANPETLRRFVSAPEERNRLLATFAALHGLEDAVPDAGGTLPAWQAALREPSRWVLKPQREGGGNNFFDQDLVNALAGSSARDRQSYILMERIHPLTHRAWLVRDGRMEEAECVSEIGRYGVLLAEGDRCVANRDAGYLVRTRPSHVRESGVSAGFGCLDSLLVAEERG